MTIAIPVALVAVLLVAVLGVRRLRRDRPERDLGRVGQSWLMEQRADSQRDRFS
ncbi:MAG: hypothetical protein AB7I25_09425 [Vicinamibacterales bacterium]